MSEKWVMFFMLILLVGNLLCLAADGDWLGSTDSTQMNQLTGHSVTDSGGIPVLTQLVGFFKGFWKMVSWDFSFFQGALEIIRWFLFILTVGVIYSAGREFRSTITSIFTRR